MLPALVAALLVAQTPPARAEIEAVLAEMSRAVLAADQPAFLSRIAQDDPCLATEWRHWAEQLPDAKPVEFSLDIGEGKSTFEPTRAEFPLKMSWLCTSGPKESWGSGGTRRTIEFPPVAFTKEEAQGGSRWLFRGEAWERRQCDGFVICYLPGSEKVVDEIARAFPVARDHDNEGFGVHPAPQVLKLYTSMPHLQATVYLNMPDQVLGGWNEKGESIKFMTTYTRGVRAWTNAYAHEYGHVCTWDLGPMPRKLPWWSEEGVAELAAQDYRDHDWDRIDAEMRLRLKGGTLAAWDDISDYITTAPNLKHLAYIQGHHMLGYITLRWGREGRNAWLRDLTAGVTLDEATAKRLGRPFAQLDREWRESLAANNPPAPPVKE
jgi:hypothetical protein